MSVEFTLPFWGTCVSIFVIGCAIAFIISLLTKKGPYGRDVFNDLFGLAVFVVTIFIVIGMIIGKYVF